MKDDSQPTRILSRDVTQGRRVAPGSILRQRYRLNSEIGRGGMGVVYRATDLDLMREVAVKVLPGSATAPEARARLLREARAAAALNHPHIVAVHDVGEAQGMPFLVMELVHGPSLAQARPVEIVRIVEIACQICAALEHAHTNSIVHRDLKPDNVLFSGPGGLGSVKLADLGLALPGYAERISRTGTIMGTASYMAPEQALGRKIDGRADLYALGVLLYELITGRLPFAGDSPLAIISQHIHAPVVPPRVLRPDLPRPLEAVILRLLEKDPIARFTSAHETAKSLRESMTVSEASWIGDAAGSVAILDALTRGRLIGRSLELAEARELWLRARHGHGHAVLFSGEPGAGKTRLARELTTQAAVDGALILSGGCYEYETTPYLPFVEAFRRWVREQKDDKILLATLRDEAVQIAKLAPEINSRLGPFREQPPVAPHQERLLFFDAVVKVLANLACQQGLVFYVDDLQWADRGTLWLLSHLLRQLREKQVLIVGAYRDTELDRTHPLATALVDWNRERLVTRIPLRRFKAAETAAHITALLGDSVGAEFSDAVHQETEGNPFFIEEVLKSIIEQGSLRRESGRWTRYDVAELVLPQSVKEAIGIRLNRLAQESNEVLRAAAVLGKSFSFQELMATTGDEPEEAILEALDEALSAQLITSGSGDLFAFTHDKIREVLYEELNPIRRRRLHRIAAERLERTRETSHEALEKLAHHYVRAGDEERGLYYAQQAAVETQRLFPWEGAYDRLDILLDELKTGHEAVSLNGEHNDEQD